MTTQRALLAALIGLVGVLALIAGVIWLTVETKSLPSFMGQIHGDPAHRSLRGVVAVIVGVLLVAAGLGLVVYRPAPTTTETETE
jgi:hypothetical protein